MKLLTASVLLFAGWATAAAIPQVSNNTSADKPINHTPPSSSVSAAPAKSPFAASLDPDAIRTGFLQRLREQRARPYHPLKAVVPGIPVDEVGPTHGDKLIVIVDNLDDIPVLHTDPPAHLSGDIDDCEPDDDPRDHSLSAEERKKIAEEYARCISGKGANTTRAALEPPSGEDDLEKRQVRTSEPLPKIPKWRAWEVKPGVYMIQPGLNESMWYGYPRIEYPGGPIIPQDDRPVLPDIPKILDGRDVGTSEPLPESPNGEYAYTLDGRLLALHDSKVPEFDFEYTADGRLIALHDRKVPDSDFEYTPDGRLIVPDQF
ncbi:hypothetical protein diail_1942 [Diaporthe ilicicola]|nr:hypothetical protein diail_1942 [Diaporthe ilicicola]